MTSKNPAPARGAARIGPGSIAAFAALLGVVWCVCATGCSTSSSAAPSPIGQAVASCSQCPATALCAGTLSGPTTPINYCTMACKDNADCPSGTGCVTAPVNSHCLRLCGSNADCQGGFVCRSDIVVGASICWSGFDGTDAVLDGSPSRPDTGTGAPHDAASPRPDAGVDAALAAGDAGPGEGGSSPDASPEAEADASADAASDVDTTEAATDAAADATSD